MQISKIDNFLNISYKGNEIVTKKENFTSKINLKSEDSFVSKHKKEIKIGAAILTAAAAIFGAVFLINKKGGSKAVEKVTNEIANNDEVLNKAEKIQETVSEKLEPLTFIKTTMEKNGVEQPIVINIDETTGKPVYDDLASAFDYLYFNKISHLAQNGGDKGLYQIRCNMRDAASKGMDVKEQAETYLEKHEELKQALMECCQISQLRDEYYEGALLPYESNLMETNKNSDIVVRCVKFGDGIKQFFDEKTKTFDEIGLREFCKKA